MTINEILMVTSLRKCGIATYSQDLIKSIEDKYCDSFTKSMCFTKTDVELHYPSEVTYFLKQQKIIKDREQ
jgi:hypothetical protein